MNRRLLGTVLLLLLSGCATLPPPEEKLEPVLDAANRETTLLALQSWSAKGRIAVKSDTGGGQGNFRWAQAADDSRVRVSGPLGFGAFEILFRPDLLEISDKEGTRQARYEGPDAAEQFLESSIGWSLPAGSTRYWLLGLEDPQRRGTTVEWGEDGLLRTAGRGVWKISWEEYRETEGLPMPRKIRFENQQASIRLIVDQWDLPLADTD